MEELPIKVEKHYLPQAFELVATLPNFVLDTEDVIEASVDGAFITERLALGNVFVRWLAKKIDYETPMYNDTVLYREVEMKIRLKNTERCTVLCCRVEEPFSLLRQSSSGHVTSNPLFPNMP